MFEISKVFITLPIVSYPLYVVNENRISSHTSPFQTYHLSFVRVISNVVFKRKLEMEHQTERSPPNSRKRYYATKCGSTL